MKYGVLLIGLLLITAFLTGCIQDQTGKVILRGSGATFPQPQLDKWIDTYTKQNPDVLIEYTGKGSGGGQNDFMQGLADFACSDPPIRESLWTDLEDRGAPLQFPLIVGAVVVVHNVPGAEDLRLDGETLADIFLGNIEYWDDPRITDLNPDADLPHKRIMVVHRSDSSGTTDIFTNYLSMVNSDWNDRVGAGKTVEWFVDQEGRGVGGKGNPGVIVSLEDNDYSIAYTELSYVYEEDLKTVSLKNSADEYVEASPETIKEAVSNVKSAVPAPSEGYKEDVKSLLNAEGENSYPVIAFSHMLMWKNYDNKDKEEALNEFVKWMLTEGQKEENLATGYVGLPEEITEKMLNEFGL
ncbi:MAG: phosphate ABC transporter substrate-binding protein PstS [Archaeoglobaceae archaeon]